eukprot:CAMPEP_0185548604 /NCGR_PEP_ID=MMETSP1381-20130426/6860_1 /TAXON_ID=298111 /ORGANISM="Pavlova sp., Strain CCMP459" /LENGTH=41 /DNA_ID= /DNA_START= /DNA_END= /DNA_ORIENTATION=
MTTPARPSVLRYVTSYYVSSLQCALTISLTPWVLHAADAVT